MGRMSLMNMVHQSKLLSSEPPQSCDCAIVMLALLLCGHRARGGGGGALCGCGIQAEVPGALQPGEHPIGRLPRCAGADRAGRQGAANCRLSQFLCWSPFPESHRLGRLLKRDVHAYGNLHSAVMSSLKRSPLRNSRATVCRSRQMPGAACGLSIPRRVYV